MDRAHRTAGLRRWRLHRALSQKELGRRAGVSHVTIVHLEAGAPARLRTIRLLAAALEITPAMLMSDSASEPGDLNQTTTPGRDD